MFSQIDLQVNLVNLHRPVVCYGQHGNVQSACFHFCCCNVQAIGDGSNDLEMVANAAIGVAMGNAVPTVKAAASVVVASNDEHGVAAAFEQFVL